MKESNGSMNMGRVKTIYDKISRFTYFNVPERDDYITITEWLNGEGWDINIGESKHISLQCDELEAINYLIKIMDHDFKE